MSVPSPARKMRGASEMRTGRFGLVPARHQVLSLALLLVLLASWEGGTRAFGVPEFMVPSPLAVARWLVAGFSEPLTSPASLAYHLGVTLAEAAIGFVVGSVAGVVVGMALAHWSAAERVLYPYIQAFNALPKIAVAPLLVVWFGFGIEAKAVMAAILVFFPMLVNAMAGYHSVDPDLIELARSCNATGAQIFHKVVLPSALPFLFAGLHMATILAVLGAIVGEFVGATAGLGMLLLQYNNTMQVTGVFAVLVVLGAVGYGLNVLMMHLERHFCFWARRRKNFG
ncbi:ABC transporter permease [Methylobacterium nonmethylotrophicum]|uniref:ABC transporter permease n=1 Tax=Methylobacterium nonmethylotrophicum TaxID=1141884 RepID=A0A4Z0NP93_9HYPH|nr:ABC transporter permease [Methylobacterium nonmethylotrophicum]TGD97742.1 ABC transporter permease [Methylobacterium nonmethylotrophicum]